MPLDTLTAARDLEAAGLTRQAAEAVAHVAAVGADDARLRIIERELSEIREGLTELRGEVRGDVKLLQWIAGFNVAMTAAVLGKLLLLP